MNVLKQKTIGQPMSETEECYLFEDDEAIVQKWATYAEEKGGKWMLFIRDEYLNSMWFKSCKMYREGKFEGIKSIKTTTANRNAGRGAKDRGVIMFHCGPSDDKELMMSYGQNVVTKLRFYCNNDYASYKSDAQSAAANRTTGSTMNWLYRLSVPKTWSDANKCTSSTDPISSDSLDLRTFTPYSSPSKVTTIEWLIESSSNIVSKWDCDRTKSGHWLMRFSNDLLDKAWKKAVSLYREEKLTGIQSMKVSTALLNERLPDNQRDYNTGIMLFYCGPVVNLDFVKSCGKNLAKLMDYFEENGAMSYRFEQRTVFTVSVPSPWHRREIVEESESDD